MDLWTGDPWRVVFSLWVRGLFQSLKCVGKTGLIMSKLYNCQLDDRSFRPLGRHYGLQDGLALCSRVISARSVQESKCRPDSMSIPIVRTIFFAAQNGTEVTCHCECRPALFPSCIATFRYGLCFLNWSELRSFVGRPELHLHGREHSALLISRRTQTSLLAVVVQSAVALPEKL
jgi:hypothetical protein